MVAFLCQSYDNFISILCQKIFTNLQHFFTRSLFLSDVFGNILLPYTTPLYFKDILILVRRACNQAVHLALEEVESLGLSVVRAVA